MSSIQLPGSQKQIQEEARIKKEEQKIEDFSRGLNDILRKHYLKAQYCMTTNEKIKTFEETRQDGLDSLCSTPLLQEISPKDLNYLLSKVFLSIGRKLAKDEELNYSWKNEGARNSLIFDCSNLIPYVIEYDPCKIEYKFKPDPWEDVDYRIRHKAPKFYRRDKNVLKEIETVDDPNISLPEDFWKSPSVFIESHKNVKRKFPCLLARHPLFPSVCTHPPKKEPDSRAKVIHDLLWYPYDYTQIKEYEDIVFKRVDLSKVSHGKYEIEEAERIAQLLDSLRDDRFQVRRFLGSVYDKGNVYLLSEKIPDSINIGDWWLKREKSPFPDRTARSPPPEIKAYFELQSLLENKHYEFQPRNIALSYPRYGKFLLTMVDFEDIGQETI